MESTLLKIRMKQFLMHLNLSEGDFEKGVGLSNGFITKIGDSIRTKSMQKILDKYPQLNTVWLLTGEGSMLKKETPATDSGQREKEDTPSNEAIVSLARSNEVIARANEKLAETNYDLVQMLKRKDTIASAHPLSQLDDKEKLKYARIIRAEILKGKYPNADAVLEEWGKPGSPG